MMGVAPETVTSRTLLGISEALEEEETVKNSKVILKNTISKRSADTRVSYASSGP